MALSANSMAITNLYFKNEKYLHAKREETEIINEAFDQLFAYFSGSLKVFSVPFLLNGSEFMKLVWNALCEIPYGETASYKEIAVKIGNPNASRAVGLACNRNPIPIFVPCHRVIGSNGDITGYRGGIDTKIKLLNLEKNNF